MVKKSPELATPEAPGAVARPLTREELERCQTITATEPPPRGSLLQGSRTLFVSAPLGVELKPVARATAIESGEGRQNWRVDLALPESAANPRLPLRMERVPLQQLRAELRSRSAPAGFRPPWANASFLPRTVEKPAEHPLYVKSRRVRPLYLFDDRRQPVTDANYPWWCVGLVKSNRGQGSGVLIGSNIVLTAGHAVPWDAQNPWMTFSPGWNIPTLSLGEWPGIFAHGYVVPVEPQNFDQVAHDVALLELNYPLGDTLGYFGANGYSDDWDGNGYWISIGYPEDWGGNPEFEDSDTVEDSDSNGDGLALETEASLLKGNSGGPFWGWFQGANGPDPRVIGVASAQGAEAELPQDHDNFLAGGQAMIDLILWGREQLGNGFVIPTLSTVTSLSRFQDHIDLFTVGTDGGVYSTFWDASSGWFNVWFRLTDSNFPDSFTVPPQSVVSSLSRFQDHIDLFVVGYDGGVYSTFWDADGGWFNTWFRLMDNNFADGFTVPPQSVVSSLSRFESHIDLFVVGRDGGIYSTFWDANGGWFNTWFRLTDNNFADGFMVPPQSVVSSLSRFRDHIDLFVVGYDGGVYSTFWDASSGWFGRWFRLMDSNFPDGFTVPPQSMVSSLSRFQDHIDLFVVGRDGGVYSTFWDASSGWFGRWFRLTDNNFPDGFTAPPQSIVTCLSRYRDHIDLFVVGYDGRVWSTFWDASSGWFNRWFRI